MIFLTSESRKYHLENSSALPLQTIWYAYSLITLNVQKSCLNLGYVLWGATSSRHTLQHTATHCNTLQHTATHCNTPPLDPSHAVITRIRCPASLSQKSPTFSGLVCKRYFKMNGA